MSAACCDPDRVGLDVSGAGGGLFHPVAVAAVVIVALNDHVLKAAAPGFITGKLSDVAGLVFFPLFLQASLEILQLALGRYREPSQGVLIGAAIASAAFFAAMKLTTTGADLYRGALAFLQWGGRSVIAVLLQHDLPLRGTVALTMDATDVLCVPMVLVAVALGARRQARR